MEKITKKIIKIEVKKIEALISKLEHKLINEKTQLAYDCLEQLRYASEHLYTIYY